MTRRKEHARKKRRGGRKKRSGGRNGGNPAVQSSQSDSDEDLFGDSSEAEEEETRPVEEPPSKRARKAATDDDGLDMDEGSSDDDFSTGDPNEETPTTKKKPSAIDPQLVEHAKSRLSKWAARLFDPNRPRGLVQAPETIPLNDEFLKAFGQRERKERGGDTVVDAEFDQAIETEDEEEEDGEGGDVAAKKEKNKKKKKEKGTKVKVNNLSYTTQESLLRTASERFGPLLEVNLIMNKENPKLNAGRGYVVFENAEDADKCIKNLKELGGRQLRLALASEKTTKSSKGGSQSLLNRYWEKDISTRCFRCGQVGHFESDCKNPAKPRPCFLCGSTDHPDRNCPYRQICFNCGCPGHVVRECPYRRGLPKRMVCGVCFQGGHHKFSCRNYRGSGDALARDAVCMDCGQLGHFLCRNLVWFHGLRGLSCFNCGGQGHLGYECTRPSAYQCRDDPELANKEIERAEAESSADLLQQSQQSQQPQQWRGRQMGREGGGGGRHRSMPPQQSRRGYQTQATQGFSNNGGGGRRNSGQHRASNRGHNGRGYR